MDIAVFGLGYVGLTAAVCLASEGHRVIGVDISETKVAQANAGISPISEPGLEDLLRKAVAGGSLWCTVDPVEAVRSSDVAIVCVGTPTGPDGLHNLGYVAEVSRQIAQVVDRRRSRPLTVVYRSTVRPGTVENLILPIFTSVAGNKSTAVDLVYNPEFLRESTAIKDYFHPPKIVVGTVDGSLNERMEELNKNLRAPIFYTCYREAEFTKFADNAFHALKVAFANEIGRVCQELDVDVAKVYEIFVSDTKLNISKNYLRPGGPFGGSCLPKDVRALQFLSAEFGGNTHVIEAILRSNDAHKDYIFRKCIRDLEPGAKVLLLGLAFKAQSDDLRDSPNVDLARRLIHKGYKLKIYDPDLRPHLLLGQNLGYAYSNLPTIGSLLLSREAVEAATFDLVLDANGLAGSLSPHASRIIDIREMR
jgi:GDP-mannose 6-dehydrogenase